MYYRFFLLYIILGITRTGWSQECNHFISGVVIEAQSGKKVPFASVFIEETGQGTVSNEEGAFIISHLCNTQIQLTVSYLGYQTYKDKLEVAANKDLVIKLQPINQELDGVDVSARGISASDRYTQLVSKQQISDGADKNLANMLETLTGVSALKNGGGISKPVVQGLYGNRLTILNNGIPQSGQQWGNDHSPEIDPLVANRIKVLGGVEAIQYMGNSLGTKVLIEPESLKKDKILSGQAGYYFESNGLGNGTNLQLQQSAEKYAWKINGTLKKRGDQKAANYYLTNTGVEEANVAFQLESVGGDRWNWSTYISSFNSQIGVLRGSHIGNLTDLQEALKRDEPFYTKDHFSYSIEAPRQTVNHHLGKFKSRLYVNDSAWFGFVYAIQFNKRKEYDVRKGGRSNTPAMNITQLSQYLEAIYATKVFDNWRLKSGLQFQYIDNINDAETGILPLIPDYNSFETGLFSGLKRHVSRWQIEIGGRYDYKIQNVAAISNTLPREVIRYNNHFNNVKLGLDTRYFWTSDTQLLAGINFSSRSPEVNELYSNGLHQGVGGIEEGDPALNQEKAFKGNLAMHTSAVNKLQLEVATYYQYIHNYIYLNPQDEVRLTIRGAFPVFKYEQTDAHIFGVDFTGHYHLSEKFKFSAQYSYLRGHDLTNDLPLINMPSNNLKTSFRYHQEEFVFAKNVSFEIHQQYVFKQDHLLPEQDYVSPPDAYHLIGLKLSAENALKHGSIRYYLKVENLFNVAYRDYLNRMRYFADDLGRNVVLGASVSF